MDDRKLILLIFLIVGCRSPFLDSFKQIRSSIEKSNAILQVSNRKILKEIKAKDINAISNKADSIQFANQDLNDLIDEYKKEIENLDLIGSDEDIAYEVLATPDFIKGALMSATSTLVKRVSKVEIDQSIKAHLDSLISEVAQAHTNSLYFEQHFKGIPSSNALAELAKLQLQSSEMTNISLVGLLNKKFE
ncbi:hypothetical protein ACFE6N_12180 [Pedobacter sp. BG31]|uniref:hypothetical protein n=1 Tax=Pedobacter sp. BG31 TaxID=3349697 RepID=UPI0035F243A6